jgi:hypothetical protein
MDFIIGLPKSESKIVIMVVVDRLTKYSHFFPLSHLFSVIDIAKVILENIYKLHGMSLSIVSDRDVIFTSRFWKEVMEMLGIKLNYSTTYHP